MGRPEEEVVPNQSAVAATAASTSFWEEVQGKVDAAATSTSGMGRGTVKPTGVKDFSDDDDDNNGAEEDVDGFIDDYLGVGGGSGRGGGSGFAYGSIYTSAVDLGQRPRSGSGSAADLGRDHSSEAMVIQQSANATAATAATRASAVAQQPPPGGLEEDMDDDFISSFIEQSITGRPSSKMITPPPPPAVEKPLPTKETLVLPSSSGSSGSGAHIKSMQHATSTGTTWAAEKTAVSTPTPSLVPPTPVTAAKVLHHDEFDDFDADDVLDLLGEGGSGGGGASRSGGASGGGGVARPSFVTPLSSVSMRPSFVTPLPATSSRPGSASTMKKFSGQDEVDGISDLDLDLLQPSSSKQSLTFRK